MSSACPNYLQSTKPNRREILRAGGLGLLGLSLPDLLRGRAAGGQGAALAAKPAGDTSSNGFGRAKSCILLFMWGGPAHQDTWDLKPDAPAEIRGEFKPIATRVPGIQICEHFPQLAQRTDKLAIVRSMTHTNVDHTMSTSYLLTGHAPPTDGQLRSDWPHMGAVLARLGRGHGVLPPFVSMRPKLENDVPRFVEQSHGQFAGWLGQAFDPLTIDADPSRAGYRVGDFELPVGVSTARLDQRRALLEGLNARQRIGAEQSTAANPAFASMDHHYRKAFELLASSSGGDAFDLTREPDAVRDRYGRNPHGQSVLQARRLVERGVPLVTSSGPTTASRT